MNPAQARGRGRLWCSVTAVVILTVACVQQSQDASHPNIVGGQPVAPGGFPAVLAIVARDNAGAPWRLSCTGTLITPQVVLTAGHCLDGWVPQPLPSYAEGTDDIAPSTVRVADGIDRQAKGLGIALGAGVEGGIFSAPEPVDQVVPVTRWIRYPFFREHPLGIGDIGLIFLDHPVAEIIPARIPTTLSAARSLLLQKGITLVGYGRREDDGLGVKFEVKTAFSEVTPLEAFSGGAGRDACDGDSGGPAFAAHTEDTLWQIGVVARGANFECGSGGFLTITTQTACWIRQAIDNELGPDGFPYDVDACQGVTPSYEMDDLHQVDFEAMCMGEAGSLRQQKNARNIALMLANGDCHGAAASLAAKEDLDLSGAMLDDISPLSGSKAIRTLRLVGNFLTDVTPLLTMPQLRRVDLAANLIQDREKITFLRQQSFAVRGLRRQLGRFAQTAFLEACANPATPPAARRTIQAIMWKTLAEDCTTANQRLLAIRKLALRDRQLTDISPLFGLEQLERLDLSSNPIEDVSPLSASENLKFLDISGTAVRDLSALRDLMTDGLKVKGP